MKFTPRGGAVRVGISCVLVSTGSHTAIRDKVLLLLDRSSKSIGQISFWLLLFQFGPDAVGFFRVEVTDSGVGLTEEEQRNIFGEFTQFNKNELQGGGNFSIVI